MKAGHIHMIGHSLGAHAASEVGTKVKGIGRISGRLFLELPSLGHIECLCVFFY